MLMTAFVCCEIYPLGKPLNHPFSDESLNETEESLATCPVLDSNPTPWGKQSVITIWYH